MTYDEKIEWLFSQFPSYQKVGERAFKPGLGTMMAFDQALDHPHTAFRTIHIAGTNGKGSTSHMLASALSACGMKTGLYTSPHLTDFRERARIVEHGSYRYITREAVESFLDRWRPFFDTGKPSFFEITTAMAFDWFRSEKVDIAVIETGLGGRLDSTNVIMPELSIITNIGLEHCTHLGFTLEEIAGEKAGIIKPGVPVVIGESSAETRPVFEAKARECGSRILFAAEMKQYLDITPAELDLKGDYQQKNLRTVDAAASVLGLPGKEAASGIRRAAAATGLRGRWETLRKAGEGKAKAICDTGHNAHGIRWIREQVDRICCDYDNIFFIFGVVADKDIDAIATVLPHDVNYIFTQPSCPRALSATGLANAMHDHGIVGRTAPTVGEAICLADSICGEKDLILIGGSNFTVCEALEIFDRI